MRNYTATPTWHDIVALADDADPPVAASFDPGFEGCLDNIAAVRAELAVDIAALASLINDGFPDPLWPKLLGGREVQVWQPFRFAELDQGIGIAGAAWTDGFVTAGTYGSIGGPASARGAYLPLEHPMFGNELVDIVFYFTPANSHVGVPATLPTFELIRTASEAIGTAPEVVALISADTPADATEWNAGINNVTLPCSHVVDPRRHYALRIVDEHGANSVAGGRYWAARVRWNVTEVRT